MHSSLLRVAVAVLTIAPLCRAQGIITTVAGSGTLGYSGDGGAATSADTPSNQEILRRTIGMSIRRTPEH